jgi:hypothetical protein
MNEINILSQRCKNESKVVEKKEAMFLFDFFDNVRISFGHVWNGSGLAVLAPVRLLPLLRLLHDAQLLARVQDVLGNVAPASDAFHLSQNIQNV